MARVLGVSRSEYYKYLNRHKDRSVAPDLTNFLQEKWLKSRKNYGFKRLFQEVKKSNLPYGARKVRKAINSKRDADGLSTRHTQTFGYTTETQNG
ncbi:hypothetical protein LEP1GSC013_1183 [Leptospira interrogans serovar Valbuzzi str. Duyster]|uniref:HTH-like domain protein n=1 Tax=Leptospira kirschneri str. H1 TaxID=1049966 RepID=A0A0E2B2G2_9LEPT|nr:hypothetical protein LEP1GSC081_1248 [Leptospira kirschneri str. H1]EMJ58833.1 hypothetical protein LEP1GSC013_1183 [Leptospira interrogans serovar Valbuzzi str. Duyster]ENO72683.1 hypothetical protein LEP1GSC012_2776 [Leptospira interrogans serovar Valbuzzi str. Valbuzzi]